MQRNNDATSNVPTTVPKVLAVPGRRRVLRYGELRRRVVVLRGVRLRLGVVTAPTLT